MIKIGNLILRRKNLMVPMPPSNESEELVKHMIEEMHIYQGSGLAAPQYGVNLLLFVADLPPDYPEDLALIVYNPKVIRKSKEREEAVESCLSIPEGDCYVNRAKNITITYQDSKGQPRERTFEDFAARIVQHELDHLQGILIIDRSPRPPRVWQRLAKPVR